MLYWLEEELGVKNLEILFEPESTYDSVLMFPLQLNMPGEFPTSAFIWPLEAWISIRSNIGKHIFEFQSNLKIGIAAGVSKIIPQRGENANINTIQN